MTTICIFGDSITWGASDSQCGGWVARLRNHLESKDGDIEIYNCGISGDNTNKLLRRLKTEATAREPNIIIFAIGINDSQYVLSKDNPRVNLKQFEKNLEALVNQAKKLVHKIIFIGLTTVEESKTMPILWSQDQCYSRENVAKYNSTIKNFCQKNKLLFVDIFNLLKNTDLEDGLHPNSQGHQKMFEQIREYLINHKIIS